MAKGFDKSITNENLRRYAPLTRTDNHLIRILQKTTDCVYGEDFILDQRTRKIYATKKLIQVLHEVQNGLESNFDKSGVDVLQLIINSTEETDNIDESEFYILVIEAFLWRAYKLLHDGSNPRIKKDFCVYSEEEIAEIGEKMTEVSGSSDSDDEFLEDVVVLFLEYLKNQGYFYHFINYEISPSN
jgi:hypothetical protein